MSGLERVTVIHLIHLEWKSVHVCVEGGGGGWGEVMASVFSPFNFSFSLLSFCQDKYIDNL